MATSHLASDRQPERMLYTQAAEVSATPTPPRVKLGANNPWAGESLPSPVITMAELGTNNLFRGELSAITPPPTRAELEAYHIIKLASRSPLVLCTETTHLQEPRHGEARRRMPRAARFMRWVPDHRTLAST